MWNNNRMSSSSSSMMKNHRLRSRRRRRRSYNKTQMNTEYDRGRKIMIWNNNNRLMGSSSSPICDLPEEVLTEVLVRLSAKDILPCVSVQKSWHSLIKTPSMFITLHSNYHHHHKVTNSKKYLLFYDVCTGSYTIRIDDIQCEEYLRLKYPTHLCYSFENQLVSDGLICLFDDIIDTTKTRHEAIYLCNPVIQKYKTLPPSPLPPSTLWKAIAFGFVQEINDYLVVHIGRYGFKNNKPHTHYYIVTCVYSLSTDSWEKITLDDSSSIPPIDYISQRNSVFVNGVAIWAGSNSRGDRLLLCFDTKTEMLRQILLPQWRSIINYPVIHAFDQSIAYFVENNEYNSRSKLDVWVLKGDPMNEFVWEKKMTVTEGVEGRVMGVRNNGEPILCNDFDLISYNFDSCTSYDFVKSWNSWDIWEDGNKPIATFVITPFAESLALLDVDCTQY